MGLGGKEDRVRALDDERFTARERERESEEHTRTLKQREQEDNLVRQTD